MSYGFVNIITPLKCYSTGQDRLKINPNNKE